MHLIVVKSIKEEDESDSRVDVNDDETKHCSHKKLVTVQGYTLDDTLKLWESVDHVDEVEGVKDGRLEEALQREGEVD